MFMYFNTETKTNKNKQTNKTNKKTDQEHFTGLRLDKTPTVICLSLLRVFEFLSIASSIQYVAYIAGVCKRLVRRLSNINRQAFTRDRFGKCKRIEGKKHNFCTLNACEILIHKVVIFLSEVIFVFLLFLGMVMYAI